MDRTSARAAAVALLGVLAVAVAAATLPDTVQPSGGGGGVPTGDGGATGPAVTPTTPAGGGSASSSVPPVVVAVVVALVLLVLLALLVRHRRTALPILGLFLALTLAGGVIVSLLLLVLDPSGFSVGGISGGAPVVGGGTEGETGDGSSGPIPPAALLALLVVAIVGTVAFARRRSGANEADEDENEDGEASDDAAAVGRAAGRAADRLESSPGASVENEVYRAWGEMTALLDLPNPETTTPGEFEAAAVEAGVDADDVGELTRLFEDARYGGYDPTAADEERAVAVLRRIEATYAGDGS